MQTSFYLDRIKKTDLLDWAKNPNTAPDTYASIWLYLTWSGNRHRYNTGQKVRICDWEDVRILKKKSGEIIEPVQRVKTRVTGSNEVNAFLDAIESKVRAYSNQCALDNITPSKASILNLLNAKEEKYDFESSFRRFIKESETGIRRTKDGKVFKEGTMKGYRNVLQTILDFQKYTGKIVTWDNINDKFYNQLTNYYWDTKGYFDNYTGRNIKVLKTFLNWSLEENLIQKQLHTSKWKTWEEKIDIVVFYPDELKALYNLKLSGKMEEDRDFFLAGCMTCLRISNLVNLKPDDLQGDELKVVTSKRGRIHHIPVNPILKQIFTKYLAKYNRLLPFRIEQKFNEGIKELAGVLGDHLSTEEPSEQFIGNEWSKQFTRVRFRRGEPVNEVKDLKDMITSHTMRRTGITNLLIAGLSEIEVKEISDHSMNSKDFPKYVNIAKRFIEKKSSAAWGDIMGDVKLKVV